MKKDIQRTALAAIIGTLAIMTGCDQSDDSNKNAKTYDQTQDHSMKQGMDDATDQRQKPMPYDDRGGMNSDRSMDRDQNRQNRSNGSQRHYYCD